MERQIENLPGGKLRLTFTLSSEERERFEAAALKHLASELKLDGFRPGHVPPTVVKNAVKPEAQQEELLHRAIRTLYPALLKAEQLEVVGNPEVNLVASEPFSFTLIVAKLPEVHLGNWQKIKVKRQPVKVDDKQVDEVVTQLRDSRATEAAVARGVQLGDRVEMDFEVAVDRVVLDGGKQTKYPAVLGKSQLVPGFEENLLGLKAGEAKQFTITFPKDYRKDLAGKQAQVSVTLNQVFQRTLPELTDEFAKNLGRFASATDFTTKLRENLLEEGKQREEDRVERAMLEELVASASFGDMPELLLSAETDKMLHELKHSLQERGVTWADYLVNIRKDEAGLRQEFREPAQKRVKITLVSRFFSRQEGLEADELAVDEEIAKALERYGSDKRAQEQLNHPDYRDYMKMVLTNRRVIEWLKKKLVE